jgi:biopolymer transport protein ExbD
VSNWDVFHTDRLEVERGLSSAAVRESLRNGQLSDDDLIRPAGTSRRWDRLGDSLDQLDDVEPSENAKLTDLPSVISETPLPLHSPSADPILDEPKSGFDWADPDEVEHEVASESPPSQTPIFSDASDFDDIEILDDSLPSIPVGLNSPPVASALAMPVTLDDSHLAEDEFDTFDPEEEYDPLDEDEAIAEFTLSRGSAETVEELDLAAMVDVAFQLVLFFLVTATTVLYKSLEVPKPNADAPAEAAAQGRSKSLDELKADYILVEVDAQGIWKIDRQPIPGTVTMPSLAEKLRTLRTDTGRTAMLFSADFATPHRIAVLAYDAANEIGLMIKIAKPSGTGVTSLNPPPVIKNS